MAFQGHLTRTAMKESMVQPLGKPEIKLEYREFVTQLI